MITDESIKRVAAKQAELNKQARLTDEDGFPNIPNYIPQTYNSYPDYQHTLDKHPVKTFEYSADKPLDNMQKAYDKSLLNDDWFQELLENLIVYPDFKSAMRNFMLNGGLDVEAMKRITNRARWDYASSMVDYVVDEE